MTQEIYNKLKCYESTLSNANDNKYFKLNSDEFNDIADIYTEVFNKKITKAQLNCNSCRVKIVKEIAKAFLNFKQLKKRKNNNNLNL